MKFYDSQPAPVSAWLAEVFQSHELLAIFAWRHLKVRFRQTAIGVLWAVVQPVMILLIFGLLFRTLGAQPTNQGVPFQASSICALLAWLYFSTSLTFATQSLVNHQHIITKVYFPRLVIPISMLLSSLLDFAIGFLVTVGILFWYGITPGLTWLWLPVTIGLMIFTTTGFALWLSALNTRFRDVQYIVPFLLQILLFISPILYETNAAIPTSYQSLYALNPLVGVMELFRITLLPGYTFSPWLLMMSFLASMMLFVTGLKVFIMIDEQMTDRI